MAWKPDYATGTELGSYVRVHDTADATEMASAVTAASRAIDDFTKRQFGVLSAAAARYFTAWWSHVDRVWKVDIEDLMTTTNLEILTDDGTGDYDAGEIDVADIVFEPRNAEADSEPWTGFWVRTGSSVQPLPDGCGPNRLGLPTAIKVTAIWGWTAVPSAVKYATLLQASRFLTRRDSPYGVAGSPPRRDSGSGISVAAKELKLLDQLDPDVAASLEHYRRDWHIA